MNQQEFLLTVLEVENAYGLGLLRDNKTYVPSQGLEPVLESGLVSGSKEN